MDLEGAQEIIGRVAENPAEAAKIPAHDIAVAAATVLVHSGLIGLSLSQATINVVTTEGSDG